MEKTKSIGRNSGNQRVPRAGGAPLESEESEPVLAEDSEPIGQGITSCPDPRTCTQP